MKFTVVLGVWLLSYLSKEDIDSVLDWAKVNAQHIIFVEPVHEEGKDIEYFLDDKQGMILRAG